MSKAVLITGGNLGSVAENLEAAREAISREVGVVERCPKRGDSKPRNVF